MIPNECDRCGKNIGDYTSWKHGEEWLCGNCKDAAETLTEAFPSLRDEP